MISAEIGTLDNGDLSEQIEIYFDREGLDYLLARLAHISNGKVDHVELMSESWCLGDLSEKKHRDRNRIAHHISLILMDSSS